jgi:6-phosphofructokinase 2
VWTRGGHIGALLGELLAAEGLASRPVPVRGPRTSPIVHETSTGLQYRFGTPGASLGDDEIAAVLDAVTSIDPPPQFLVASGSVPHGLDPDFHARLAAAASPATRVVVDTSGEPLRRALGAGVFLVKTEPP